MERHSSFPVWPLCQGFVSFLHLVPRIVGGKGCNPWVWRRLDAKPQTPETVLQLPRVTGFLEMLLAVHYGRLCWELADLAVRTPGHNRSALGGEETPFVETGQSDYKLLERHTSNHCRWYHVVQYGGSWSDPFVKRFPLGGGLPQLVQLR